jgi:hypothetical protein
LLVYLRTLAPGVYGFDSAELATGAFTLGIVHPTGYPLYLLLAKAFTFIPLRNVAYRVNLLSAVLGALTIWLVARLAGRLSGSRWAGWMAAGLLGFSYTFWSMSVVAEVYTLHTALIALQLLLLDRWLALPNRTSDLRLLRWLALIFGLSLTNHVSAVLFAPALIFPVLRSLPARRLLRELPSFGLLFGLGLAPYLYLPIRFAAEPPLNYVGAYYDVDLTTLKGMWWMVTGQAYRFFAFGYDLAGYMRELIGVAETMWRNLTGLGIVLGGIGLITAYRSRLRLNVSLLIGFALTTLFFAGYAVADKASMFLAPWSIWAVWMAVGAAAVVRWINRTIRSHGTPATRLVSTFVRASAGAAVIVVLLANVRWLDMSRAFGPELYARQVLDSVPENAMVMGPWSSAVILEYFQQVEGMRPDVQIFNRSRYEVAEYYKHWAYGTPHPVAVEFIQRSEGALVDQAIKLGPVYDLEYEPRLATQFEYQPIGRLFVLSPRNSK